LAAPLQRREATRIAWLQTAGNGGVRTSLRRAAGCAPTTSSAGHNSETAGARLTFNLD
jgi:hypothetical protein